MKQGWGNLAKGHYVAYVCAGAPDQRSLAIGLVLENTRSDRTVLVHCMEALWETVNLKWKLVYITNLGEGDKETLKVTDRPKTEPVLYSALRLQVDLLVEVQAFGVGVWGQVRGGLLFGPPPRR